MIEWQQFARSIRCKYNGFEADVWCSILNNGKKVYNFTVMNEQGHYIDSGMKATQDQACEEALIAIGLG